MSSRPASSSKKSFEFAKWGKVYTLIWGSLVLLGGVHLRSYLASWGVPFPFELGGLGAILLMFGLTSLLITFILLSTVFIIGLVKTSAFGVDYYEIAATTLQGNQSEHWRDKLINTAVLIAFPILLGIISFIFYRPAYPFDNQAINSIFICTLLLAYSSGWIALAKQESDGKIFRKLAYIFVIQFVCFFFWSFLVLIPISFGIFSEYSDPAFFFIVVVAALSLTFSMYPFGNHGDKNLELFRHIGTVAIIVGLTAASLMPDISSYIGKETLRFFTVGGEIKQSIYFPEDQINRAPKNLTSFINEFELEASKARNEDEPQISPEKMRYAFAMDVNLVFKNGDHSYFKRDDLVFRINTKDLVVISYARKPTFLSK